MHDYILRHTPYVDVIAGKYPGEFKTTTAARSRIDFVYCTPPLYERITHADVVTDAYTEPVRDPAKLSNFWAPLGPPSDRGGLQYEMRQRIK